MWKKTPLYQYKWTDPVYNLDDSIIKFRQKWVNILQAKTIQLQADLCYNRVRLDGV